MIKKKSIIKKAGAGERRRHSIWPFKLLKYLLWVIPGLYFSCSVLGKKYIKIKVSSKLFPALLIFLRYNSCFNMEYLVDICTSDLSLLNIKYRFSLTYLLLNVRQNFRLLLQIKTIENIPLPSIADLFNSAVWLEREAWDMFGIYFTGGIDLRRILTDYSFIWFPLRKNFPVVGFYELFFDDYVAHIVREPVQFMQEPRVFFTR